MQCQKLLYIGKAMPKTIIHASDRFSLNKIKINSNARDKFSLLKI